MSLRPHALPALAAFAAAARQLNFARAGAELNLTAAAVSHHIRKLEAQLGIALFQRQARGVALTAEGRLLADAAALALGDLEQALAGLRRTRTTPRVHVSVLPSLCAAWLSPRVARFAAAHPELRVVIESDRSLARFDESGPDLALRYGPGNWPGLAALPLMDDQLIPAASPELPGVASIVSAADIATLPLIGDLSQQGWADWFRAAGLRRVRATEMHSFSDSSDALNAAAAGMGAVLARWRLARPLLQSGRLRALPGPQVKAGYAYYLVHPQGRVLSPEAQAFVHWVQAEARADGSGEFQSPR